MKDERYWPVLGTWLKDTTEAPPDPGQTSRKVSERLSQTPQLRRQWWLPSMRRSPTPSSEGGRPIDDQPASILTTKDSFSTTTGRTRLMFSPVKAIIVGAIIFVLGGAFLIAQPTDQRPVAAPGAEATRVEGTRVSVAQSCDRGVEPPACTWTSDDPRLTGTFTHEESGTIVSVAGDDGDFWWADATLEGAEGSWSGRLYLSATEPSWGFAVLSGVAAYEGWHYVATGIGGDGRHDDWTGIVYEGELPPFGPRSDPASE
jgi:hypothetical protein